MAVSYILTKHARERLDLRAISESKLAAVLSHPDKTTPGKKAGTHKFVRQLDGREIHVVASFLDQPKKWLILSVWVRGESDPVPLMWQLLTSPFRLLWWVIHQFLRHSTSRR